MRRSTRGLRGGAVTLTEPPRRRQFATGHRGLPRRMAGRPTMRYVARPFWTGVRRGPQAQAMQTALDEPRDGRTELMEDAAGELERLRTEVRAKPLPRHVAFIMDGNGRWAEAR